MIKKNIFFITSLMILAFNCSAKEHKGNGNPKIGKIVRISSAKISSEHTETELIPKYEIELESNTKYEIIELQLETAYIFGQDLNLVSSKILIPNSEELNAINNKGRVCLTVSLKPIPLEKLAHKNSEGFLNEERVSNIFIYLKYK